MMNYPKFFTFTQPSTVTQGSLLVCFLCGLSDRQEPCVIGMKKKTQMLAFEDDLSKTLTEQDFIQSHITHIKNAEV
jgi:hypothetical protein